MINIRDLTYRYPTSITPVFQNFNWEVEKADSWVVIGASGCGKTTLLYLLAGLLHPNSGEIQIEEATISRPRPRSGLILQAYGLLPWATVKENCELGLKIRKYYGADGIHAPSEIHPGKTVENWLEKLGLSHLSDKYPGQLSGGQRQRAAIARTLILEPDLLLMDEPFSSLDVPTRENLQELTKSLVAEQGLTLILITHAIEEATIMGRRILMLGALPNIHPTIIDNEESKKENFRDSTGFLKKCQELRISMGATEV